LLKEVDLSLQLEALIVPNIGLILSISADDWVICGEIRDNKFSSERSDMWTGIDADLDSVPRNSKNFDF